MENTEDKKHDEETSYARIEPYTNPAGGWGALLSVARNLKRQEVFKKGAITLLNINQPTGFDCPGCAWPEKKDAHAFNFCENGAKAVDFEATSKRVTPEFFATHTVSWLSEQSDFLLEDSGRLTDPMRYDSVTDKYVPISWDDAFALIAKHLHALDHPDQAAFYTWVVPVMKQHFCINSLSALLVPIIFQTVPICAMRPPVLAYVTQLVWVRER